MNTLKKITAIVAILCAFISVFFMAKTIHIYYLVSKPSIQKPQEILGYVDIPYLTDTEIRWSWYPYFDEENKNYVLRVKGERIKEIKALCNSSNSKTPSLFQQCRDFISN
jgi:hypothetical protein